MSYSDWGRLVAERFSSRDPATTDREWLALKERLVLDQSVTGIVIAKAPFGAWIDIHGGFPALLEIIYIDGLTPEKYRADDWCPIGTEIKAFVGCYDDRSHQIKLWQVRVGHPDA